MNGEEQEEKKDLATRLIRFFPSVTKPEYRQGLNARLKWTGIALLSYLLLSWISVYGIDKAASFQQFRFFEIVLGSRFGSLMTLGIGPIVTAGIIMQLLVGSKILNWDTTKPEGRKKFQTWNKMLAVILAFVEAVAFVFAGAVPVSGGLGIMAFVILQLAAGGIIVIILDELVSKWGFGSGISLFIAAGVSTQIVIGLISPLSAGGRIAGAIPGFFSNIGSNMTLAIAYFLPVITTLVVFGFVIYAQHIRVEIPLSYSALRGFGRTWALKLLYTSNIPVILTAALIANIQLLGRFGASVTPEGLTCGLMGCFNQAGNPVSGIVYYLSSPGTGQIFFNSFLLEIVSGTLIPTEIIRALTYTAFLVIGATIFSVFWVNTAGMGASTVAQQLDSIGMQIPGYRRDPRVMEAVLNRYIPALAVLGGIAIGLLAAFADLAGAIGTGTGILLTVMIVYNYYEQLQRENLEEAHPIIRKIVGK